MALISQCLFVCHVSYSCRTWFSVAAYKQVDGFDGLVYHSVDDKFSQYYRDILMQQISHLERYIHSEGVVCNEASFVD